jgi:hypothetical protein
MLRTGEVLRDFWWWWGVGMTFDFVARSGAALVF